MTFITQRILQVIYKPACMLVKLFTKERFRDYPLFDNKIFGEKVCKLFNHSYFSAARPQLTVENVVAAPHYSPRLTSGPEMRDEPREGFENIPRPRNEPSRTQLIRTCLHICYICQLHI